MTSLPGGPGPDELLEGPHSARSVLGDRPAPPPGSGPDPGLDVASELANLAAQMTQRRELVARLIGGDGAAQRALLLRIPDTRCLHVVGDTPLASRCRELLAHGHIEGWSLEPVAESRTSLFMLEASSATSGALERAGFATLEELEVSPDVCLSELRNMGTIRLQELRTQIPYRRRPAPAGREPNVSSPRLAAPPPGGDPLGAVLRRCWDAGAAPGLEAVVLERDDTHLSVIDAARYLGDGPRDDLERDALDWARGRVLDIGCGAGRLAVELAARGHPVRGIDTSPGAVGIAQARGLVADCASYLDPQPDEPVDTLLMLGQGAQLLAAAPQLGAALERLAELGGHGARLIIDGTNPYASADPDHLGYLDRARRAGRPGRLRVRLRDRAVATDWFDLAALAAHEMTRAALAAGWTLEHEAHGDHGHWLLVMQPPS